jgi:nucleoside-diphosphate-sugar epimerase
MQHRVVVTGATGFVGANLARRLLADGHAVHVLVRPGYATWRLAEIQSDVRLHVVSLQDRAGVERCVEEIKPEWIFHLAVHGAYASQTDVHEIFQTNVLGTVNLVEACLRTGFEAFVNTGSSSEYGFKAHAPSEQEWLEPNSHYSVTKAATTHYCRFTAQSRTLHMPTLRLYSVFGPYEEPTRLLPTIVIRALQGELPPLVNPRIARDFVYVDDVVDAYLLAATTRDREPGAVYNVGTGVQTTLAEVVDCAKRLAGVSAEPSWGSMPDRKWDTTSWVADNRRIRGELGWSPQRDFEHGFGLMLDWFRTRADMLELYKMCQGS